MSPGAWFIFWVVAGGCLGLGTKNIAGVFGGAFVGFVLWCLFGIFWMIGTAYDCTDYYNEYGTYHGAPDKCQ